MPAESENSDTIVTDCVGYRKDRNAAELDDRLHTRSQREEPKHPLTACGHTVSKISPRIGSIRED
jgi:hypothetical protein